MKSMGIFSVLMWITSLTLSGAGVFEGWTVFSVPPEGASRAALAAGYRELRQFAEKEKVGRIVYLIQYDQETGFFHPEASEEESFIQLLFSSPLPSSCELEIMFNGAPCSYRTGKTWRVPDQGLRFNFPLADLKRKMDYFADLYQKARGAITGVVLDPRDIYILNDIQKGINYVDAYLHLNSLSHYVKKGIVLPADREMFVFLNRSLLPVKPLSPLGQWVKKKGLEAFPLGAKPLWRKNNPSPLIDHVYVDVCSYETPALLEMIALNPSEGARAFLSLLTATPYKKGEGLVKFAQGGREVIGKDTSFVSEVIPGAPLGIDMNGKHIFGYAALEKPQSNELLKLDMRATLAAREYVPYYVVEALINYRMVPITYEMAQGITWMLSFKPRHFGRYSRQTLDQFTKALEKPQPPFFPHFALSFFEDIH